MIFFLLALLALVFGLLGFLAHAFYFNAKGQVGTLEKEIESLTRMLASRDQAKNGAEQQTMAAKTQVQSLENQLQQKSGQLNALQATVQRQAGEIRQLREAAGEIRRTAAQTMERTSAVPESDKTEPAAITGNGGKIPLWKDNLNNILEMLDKIEKEVEK